MTNSIKPPIWFWVVSAIALLWNGYGVKAYLDSVYQTDAFKAMYTSEQLASVANVPSWVTAAFAISVFAGLLGAILLLLRKKMASTLFLLSLLAVVAQMGYMFIKDLSANMALEVSIIVAAFVFAWFSKHSRAKGWLGG